MPGKVIPDVSDFLAFEREMKKRDFRRIYGTEFAGDFKRLGLVAPRPRLGRETGFIFHSNNGLTVRVWTTWLSAENTIRDVDAGWVLIADGDKAVYFSHPIHRTKNFFLNLFRQAWIARFRVINRPLCPQCNRPMMIVHGIGLKSRYWRCNVTSVFTHRKPQTLDWDFNLPPIAKKIVEELRKKRQRELMARKKEGKPIRRAILSRRPWQRKAT